MQFKQTNFSYFFQGDLKEKQREKELAEEENFGNSAFGQFRGWLWNVMEYPWTSKLAQVRIMHFCMYCYPITKCVLY